MYVASGEDLVVVGLVYVVTTLHTFLVPQIESHFVLGVELPTSLLLC
jgi:type II secretory pathway component PulF